MKLNAFGRSQDLGCNVFCNKPPEFGIDERLAGARAIAQVAPRTMEEWRVLLSSSTASIRFQPNMLYSITDAWFGHQRIRTVRQCTSSNSYSSPIAGYAKSSDVSRYRQKAFANCICLGVLHSASKTLEDATSTVRHLARDIATLNRFAL
ncbi:MAG: hypothetical protein ABJX32_04835 [Tateyamaria sp.]|uniref:hypothetical protein n=1 Tax=Tateyamaria sp. TaxID=1929288 RepID=UPI00329E65E6